MLLTGIVVSCRKDDEPLEPDNLHTDNQIKLGKKLENPYSVENMEKAWNNLIASSKITKTINIRTTHLYVKFKPKSEEELDKLKDDSTLILYSYPLDYQLIEGGAYYQDPEVQEGQPTYQYASVSSDYNFPEGVDYEVLSDLYIPEKDPQLLHSAQKTNDIADMLVDEALRITDNLEESSNSKVTGSKWTPAGTIKVWDDEVGAYVPVVGVEVRATRWFTTHTGRTNINGYYTCDGTFRRDANYSLKWERYHFSIRTGTFGQAEFNGPKKEGNWDKNFGNSGSQTVNDEQQYYALIFQGAYDYFYGDRFGLVSPPMNTGGTPQIKIAADISERQNDKTSHAAMYARTGGLLPSIYIREYEDDADEVYGVTTHELAHAAHWEMDRDAFQSLIVSYLYRPSAEAVVESWANGVEWQFAMNRYRNTFGMSWYSFSHNYQDRTISDHPQYTSIVVDLIDNVNQRFANSGDKNYPMDRVSAYSIQQIETGLKGAISWKEWRNNMINIHNNETEAFLPELYANWY